MLIQFNFKNFRSFRDEMSLDMTATGISEYNTQVVETAGERILPVAAVYGANASGKTNVINAFENMRRLVMISLLYGDDSEGFESDAPEPFLLDHVSKNDDTTFEVYFTVPGDQKERTYNYGFCVNRSEVTEEWLNYKSRTARAYRRIFYRDLKEMDLSGLPSNCHDNIRVALNKQVLIISLGAKLKVEKCKIVSDWFSTTAVNDADRMSYAFGRGRFSEQLYNDPDKKERLVRYLGMFDDSIRDFSVEKIPTGDNYSMSKYRLLAVHQMSDSDDMTEFPISAESAGTIKMMSLYFRLIDVLDNGGVFFIDELNSRLHPALVRKFVQLFMDSNINSKHAQLIFTIHDTSLLSTNFLRRDEIWFVSKTERGISVLYSMTDIVDDEGKKIRKDENYEKSYLNGKYGAVPDIKDITLKDE